MTVSRIRRSCQSRAESGAAMVVAIISLVVVTAFATAMLTAVDSEKTGVVLENDRTQALKFAEGVLEVAENDLITQMANYVPFPTPPASSPFQELSGQYQAGELSAPYEVLKGTKFSNGVEVAVAPVITVDGLTGLNVKIEPHLLRTSLQVGTSSLRVLRYIDTLKAPIFQFLAYYAGDLEILPGPAMTLSGRVHTNADLYMGPGASLQIATHYLRAANHFFRQRKDNTQIPAGWIKIQNATTNAMTTLPSQSDLASVGIASVAGIDSRFTGWDIDGDGTFDDPGEVPPFKNVVTELYAGTFQTGEHGVQPLAHPSINSIKAWEPMTGGDYNPGPLPGTFVAVPPGTGAYAKGYFHKNADLAIINNKVYNKQGTDITLLMPPGFITTRTLWDQRENKNVTCTQLNMGKLGDMDGIATTKDPCPYSPANGLIFVSRSDATPAQPNGVILTNGAQLGVPQVWNSSNYGGTNPVLPGAPPVGAYPFGAAEQQGFTVVASTPMYVHGHYNSIGKKPAAVITDTINLLSSAWNFTKTAGQVKTAANTTYNMAMITGNQNTTPGHYNGGFENLPRFHEDWTGKTCAITGSFVSLWTSQIATGPWIYGGAWYSAPIRNWNYETMFEQGKLPPFTPMVVTARTIAWEVTN